MQIHRPVRLPVKANYSVQNGVVVTGDAASEKIGAALDSKQLEIYCGKHIINKNGIGFALGQQGQCGQVFPVGDKFVIKVFPDAKQYEDEKEALQWIGQTCGNKLIIKGFGKYDGKPYLMFKRIDPEYQTLLSYASKFKIDQKQARGLLYQLRERFHCFYNWGVVHADLHPGNILIGRDPKSKKLNLIFIDWGIWCNKANLDREGGIRGWGSDWGENKETCRKRVWRQISHTIEIIASMVMPSMSTEKAKEIFNTPFYD